MELKEAIERLNALGLKASPYDDRVLIPREVLADRATFGEIQSAIYRDFDVHFKGKGVSLCTPINDDTYFSGFAILRRLADLGAQFEGCEEYRSGEKTELSFKDAVQLLKQYEAKTRMMRQGNPVLIFPEETKELLFKTDGKIHPIRIAFLEQGIVPFAEGIKAEPAVAGAALKTLANAGLNFPGSESYCKGAAIT